MNTMNPSFASHDVLARAIRRKFNSGRMLFVVYGIIFASSQLLTVASAKEARIIRLTIGDLGSYSDYSASSGFAITPWRRQFFRDDGAVSTWGAGVTSIGRFKLTSASIVGSSLRYEFDAASAPHLTEYTDFNGGDYGSTGTLVPSGPLVVTAAIGSSTATLAGAALITANGYGYDPPRGALYRAPIGSVIPFSTSYQLIGGTWSLDTFDRNFSYRTTGAFEFISVPEPCSVQALALGVGVLFFRRKVRRN